MKVIDLIVKQFNNEDMPKHIKINTLNYTYDYNRKTYKSEYGEFMSFDFTNNVLNMQVEVIEDEIDIDNIEKMTLDGVEDVTYFVNDLIKAVKQLNKEIKSRKEK